MLRSSKPPFQLLNWSLFNGVGNYAMVNEAFLEVKKAVGAATTVTLPPMPAMTQISLAFVKDGKGDAATNPITVQGASAATIDGAASHVINTNYGCAIYRWNGTEWGLVAVMAGDTSDNVIVTGFLIESAADSITAFATGGQTSATPLTKELNRVTTVATVGDSVKLPASRAGLTILVVNHGANAMQVFGAGTDKINDVATATGVSQMPGSVVLYTCYTAGDWYTEGLATGFAGGLQTLSFTNSVTAFATGGQGSAVALTSMLNRITVCATAGDSVKLPASAAGMTVVVANDGAASADVFPATGDLINGLAANVQVACKAGTLLTFYCEVAGTWNVVQPNLRFVSAAASAAVTTQAETIFATNQLTIKAGTLKAGQKVRVRGAGTVTTANGTLQIRVRYGGVGGVLILDTGNAITPSNGDIFQFDGSFTVTDVGATGHIYGAFSWNIGTAGTGTWRAGKTASIAIDTTTDKVLNVTQQNGTGAGSLTLDYLDVEIQ